MLKQIEKYKFIKDDDGKLLPLKRKSKTVKKQFVKKELKVKKDLKVKKKKTESNLDFDKNVIESISNPPTYDINDNYISYDDILTKLKEQKNKETNEINIFKSKFEKTKTLPVNRNKFMIHQYSFDDKRNKIHQDLQQQLSKMVNKGFLSNHILFYGLAGSGKYTLGLYILHHICGGLINERHVKSQVINKREIKYIENQYYLEVLVNNYVMNDNHTLATLINSNIKNKKTGLCQYIIIKHFDELTPDCQKTIYNIMERHKHLRFILTTRHLSKIIPNIISTTSKIRVPRPEAKLLAKYMNRISKSNDINITHNQIEYIVRSTECNISHALTTMELCVHNGTYVKSKDAHLKYVANILQVATGPGLGNIKDVRNLASKLIISTYDVSEVYKTCVKLFLNSNHDTEIKRQVIEIANKYSQLNNTTHNTIFVMEAFFLHIMRIMDDISIKKNYSLQKISKKTK
jgi:DNA polymerase III delta prime subunit